MTTGTSSDCIYKPKLVWYEEAARFLSKNMGDDPPSFSNLDQFKSNNVNPNEDIMPHHIDQVDNFIQDDQIQEEMIEVSLADIGSPNKKKARFDKKATNQFTHNTLLKTVEVLENIEKRKMVEKKEKSEFVLFGESVGKQLDLPKQDAIALQLQIQTMISKARLDHLDRE